MTSTVLQQQHTTNPTKTRSTTTATSAANMTWSNDKLRFSCIDNISLKQLWKLIALDSTNSSSNPSNNKNKNVHVLDNFQAHQQNHLKHEKNQKNQHHIHQNHHHHHQQQQQQQQIYHNNNFNEKINHENCENFADYITNRDILTPSSMSLLKFLAINALELSAPASPVLLQQNSQNNVKNLRPQGWMQLSGHPESIVPTASGIVRKRISSLSDNEAQAYTKISQEPQTSQIVPQFYGTSQIDNEYFIELQDLLAGFKDPCVMDIKMGCRTFLESEVSNKTQRADLYQKMIAVDPQAPTDEEHSSQAITKLRYMLFREQMSSSHSKGFRIEAIRLRGRPPVKDLKTVRSNDQIQQTIQQFLCARKSVQRDVIKRLKHMRSVIEQSAFFQSHEIVGSSIFIVYDDHKVGVWLIDFAKSRQLPEDFKVTHRSPWQPGNREEGLLKGFDELIKAFETSQQQCSSRKCLQI